MPQISRSTLLISIALMIAMVAAACDSPAEKPTAEPPTPIPTVASQAVSTDSPLSIRDSLADPEVLQCLSEQLGNEFDPDSGAIGPELLGRLGPQEFAMLETCGVDVAGALGGTGNAATLDDPEVQECLAGELGMDLGDGEFDLSALRQLDPTDTAAAFAACGAEFGRPGGGGGIRGGGGFVGSGIANPEIRECLTGILGEDAFDNIGQGSGIGLGSEWLEAMQECGINFGDTGGGGFQFGGREGAFGGDGGIAIPIEPPNDGTGDGADSILIEPEVEPTATSIPVSELTIEQLTCLAGELDSSGLSDAVVATSSGDFSEISDELLAALQTCGVGA